MRKRIFNLLKPVEAPKTIWDKIYDFILYRARIVILFTELLIVASFAGKVIVDTVAKNLDQQIQTSQKQLQFLSSLEPEIREIQKKDSIYRNLWRQAYSYSEIFSEITSYLVNPDSQIAISLINENISISGTDDLTSLQILEQKMKTSTTFKNVYIANLTLQQTELAQAQGQYALIATINNPLRQEI